MPQRDDLAGAGTRPRPWIPVLLSLGVHSLLVFGSVAGILWPVRLPPQGATAYVPMQGPRQVTMVFVAPMVAPPPVEKVAPVVTPPTAMPRRVLAPVPPPLTPVPPPPAPVPVDTGTRVAVAPPPPPPPPPAPAPPPRPIVGPQFGGGRLWVRPLPLPPEELARRIAGGDARIQDTAAVTSIVQMYLDSLARDAGIRAGAGGAREVVIGGVRIPAAVAGYLRLPSGEESYQQRQVQERLSRLRMDLLQAAVRSANAQDFRRAINELRQRTREEQEFRKNQRTDPNEESASR